MISVLTVSTDFLILLISFLIIFNPISLIFLSSVLISARVGEVTTGTPKTWL